MNEFEKKRLEAVRALNILDTAPEERFDRFTRVARRLFDVPYAFISIVDSDRQWFKSANGMAVSETPRSISFCTHAILESGVMVVNDATLDDRFQDNPLVMGEPGLRFYAGCPLHEASGYRVGTLCISDVQPRAFTAEDKGLLSDVASMAEQELASLQMATQDELTGLSNRRGFMHLTQHSAEFCHRLGLPASLMLFDLDGLKTVNDTYGHGEGDRLIKQFASILGQCLRESDVCGRLGGDEFAVFLPGTGRDNASRVVSRMEDCASQVTSTLGRQLDLGFSVGIVSSERGEVLDIDRMLNKADSLMYEQKRKRKKRAI